MDPLASDIDPRIAALLSNTYWWLGTVIGVGFGWLAAKCHTAWKNYLATKQLRKDARAAAWRSTPRTVGWALAIVAIGVFMARAFMVGDQPMQPEPAGNTTPAPTTPAPSHK